MSEENTEMQLESPETLVEKIRILPGASHDLSSATFEIKEEDHTLGNALRYAVMRNPQVDFCGYSIPHPSEELMNIRIQTADAGLNAVEALDKGLDDILLICQSALKNFQSELEKKDYEIVDF
ncbi:DNA-directed RNA polymerases I and III subunit RPAC2 [Smittium mucronatum]|uniref:DNA-directed RNA polymerases I and III subunit RPAC2 n=1 Tax=Smittium mucronatum TaxID=133383 RepID=A0A1R0H3G0_9FUNG|nr:DNA-directed RNA polymerases I and III subunit RPAC2 [Smittium mucronatum]